MTDYDDTNDTPDFGILLTEHAPYKAFLNKNPTPWVLLGSKTQLQFVKKGLEVRNAQGETVAKFAGDRDAALTLIGLIESLNAKTEDGINSELRPGEVEDPMPSIKARAADLLNLSIERIARAIRAAEGECAEAPEGSVAKNYLQGVRNGLAEAQLALIKDAKLLETKP